jgi:high affinity Mn2+ porin
MGGHKRTGWRHGAVLAAALTLASPLQAAETPALGEQLRQVIERLQQLEQRNAELERQLRALQRPAPAGAAAAPPAGAAPVANWGAADAALAEAEDEAGAAIEAGVVLVGQRVGRRGSNDGRSQSRLNYRGDLGVSLPAGSIGEAQGTAFAQLRFGQGVGVGLRPTHTSTVNSVGFETGAGPDDSFAILAQAGYQLEWALDGGGFNEQKGRRVELTLGKLDVFGLFDQNAAAGDEGAQFLNNVFVHNPLLDAGGDIGADAYGFAPGLRLGWFDTDGQWAWGVSAGAFGAGKGANFSGGLGKPFTIVQFELSPLQINGEPRGNYRVYAWSNGRSADLVGNVQRHSGLGVSVDQRFGREWNLFGRWGRRGSGDGAFDDALTLGFEHGGRLWGRGRDAVGAAVGTLRTGSAWRAATADGTLAGYAASGNEQLLELYYRMKLNEHLEVSPDFQWIRRPGGDGLAPTVRVFGVRASFGF